MKYMCLFLLIIMGCAPSDAGESRLVEGVAQQMANKAVKEAQSTPHRIPEVSITAQRESDNATLEFSDDNNDFTGKVSRAMMGEANEYHPIISGMDMDMSDW